MKTRKKRRGIGALLMAAVLSTAVFTGVQAAEKVETDRACEITFSVNEQSFPDFAKSAPEGGAEAMEIKLYRVADMTAAGAFGKPKGVFENLELPDGNTTGEPAAVWTALAEAAYEIVSSTDGAAAAVTATAKVGNGSSSGKAEPLTDEMLRPGLYLVAGETAESANYTYAFAPYLVSLPNNAALAAGATGGSDEWDYDVESELKLEQTDLYGDLQINKTLRTYNTTLGPITFLFQVEAVKDDGRQQTKVYSNVVQIDFDDPGSKTAKITGIPAGAAVTVTEIPAGSYSPTAASQSTDIVKGQTVSVDFTNDYNNGVIYRHTITNQFTNNKDEQGTWTWTQFTDGEQTDQKTDVKGQPPVIDTNPGDGNGDENAGGQ